MRLVALKNANVAGGALTLALSVGILIKSLGYGLGTIFRMGPGYFPMLIGALLFILGGVLTFRGLREGDEPIGRIDARPIIFIAGGMVLFSVTLLRFGLAPAALLLILVSSLASPLWRPGRVLALAVGVTLFAYVVFVSLLSMNLPFLQR